MSNQLAPIGATNTLPALPAQRSAEYVDWLIVEIGNLAAYLGQQQQLDSEGYRQAEMAKDLQNTRPDVMRATFDRLRRTCRFLPVTAEVLDVYRPLLLQVLADESAAEHRREQDALEARRKAHPEEFCTFETIARDANVAIEHFASMDLRRRLKDHPPPRRVPETSLDECPHCGKPIPVTLSDLNFFSAEVLRGIADRKDAKATAMHHAAHRLSVQARWDERKRNRSLAAFREKTGRLMETRS